MNAILLTTETIPLLPFF